jgi:hypothetical protein
MRRQGTAMSTDPSQPGIHIESLARGARITLPRRNLGSRWWIGVLVIAIGGVFTGVGYVWIARSIAGAVSSGQAIDLFVLISCVPAVLLGGFGVVPMFFGLALLAGRTTIEITVERVRVIEHAGPFRWSTSRPRRRLRRVVRDRADARESKPSLDDSLTAEFTGAKQVWLAFGYAPSIVDATATHVVDAIRSTGEDVPFVSTSGAKRRARHPRGNRQAAPVTSHAPAGSGIVVEERADGLTITVPPRGAWKASKGLLSFAILWLGFMTIFTTMLIVIPLAGGSVSGSIWVMYFMCGVFWMIGLAMLAFALRAGRASAIFDVMGDTLLVTARGVLRLRSHEWRRDMIREVACAPSGMTVNNRPVMHLEVTPHQGRTVGFLATCTDDEVAWLASRLRQALRLDAAEDASDPACDEVDGGANLADDHRG